MKNIENGVKMVNLATLQRKFNKRLAIKELKPKFPPMFLGATKNPADKNYEGFKWEKVKKKDIKTRRTKSKNTFQLMMDNALQLKEK